MAGAMKTFKRADGLDEAHLPIFEPDGTALLGMFGGDEARVARYLAALKGVEISDAAPADTEEEADRLLGCR